MKLSTDRILTTHVGSLPRPPDLLAFLEARESGGAFEQAAFDTCLAASVREIVQKQVAAGIDSVCDGELGKISYTFYVRYRLSGITAFPGGDNDQPPQTAAHRDLLDHPDYMQRLNQARGGTAWFSREAVPCCTGPVEYRDRRPLETDLRNLTAACAAAKPVSAPLRRRISAHCRAQHCSAQSCDRQYSARSHAHASLLGKLRRAAH